jgi:hypothetical protein
VVPAVTYCDPNLDLQVANSSHTIPPADPRI